jgi:regulatory protein
VIAQLKALGYLDDRRFAAQFASYRSRVKHYGKFRVTRELRAKGLSDDDVEAAVAEIFGEQDEAEAARERIQRRLRNISRPYSEKAIRRVYQALLRAGYSSDIIARELHKLCRINVEDLKPEGEATE